MHELLIPVALDAESRRAIRPHEGRSGGSYECPGCFAPVLWRRCDDGIRRSHFAHLPEDNRSCGESAIHNGAKRLLVQQALAWIDGHGAPLVVLVPCVECTHPVAVALPLDIHHAELEHNLGAALESIRPDVWLENAEGKGGAIEVFHTHAIPDEKVALYQREKIWCVELRADAILEPTPRLLVTRLWGAGSLDTRPTRCASCIRIVNEAAYGAVLDLRKIEAAYRETWDRCEVLRLKELDLKRQVAVLENALLPATKAQPFAYEPVDPYTHPAFGPRSPS